MNIIFKLGEIIFKLLAVFLVLLALILEYFSKIHHITKNKSNRNDKKIKTTTINPRLKHYGY